MLLLDERESLFYRKSVFRDVRMQANLGLMFERKATTEGNSVSFPERCSV